LKMGRFCHPAVLNESRVKYRSLLYCDTLIHKVVESRAGYQYFENTIVSGKNNGI